MPSPKDVKNYIEQHDKLVGLLGVRIDEVRKGYARVSLEVQEKHLNAAGVCQGGVIFTVADLAFALASNSHGTMALGMEVSISYLRSAFLGETITAEAKEVYLGKRTGCYIVTVVNQEGRKIALLKALSFRFDKPFPPCAKKL